MRFMPRKAAPADVEHSSSRLEKTEQERNNLHTVDTADEDVEAPIARGVDVEAIPSKYWLSWRFLGSAFSIILLAVCLYVNFTLPVYKFLLSSRKKNIANY